MRTRKIVSWELSTRLKKEFVAATIEKAIKQRNPELGLIFHSDRGSQYASAEVTNLLNKEGISQSMSSTGNSYDNATAESFFPYFKDRTCIF